MVGFEVECFGGCIIIFVIIGEQDMVGIGVVYVSEGDFVDFWIWFYDFFGVGDDDIMQ